MADLMTALSAAAGAAGGAENPYVEDVFSTYLYTGTGAAQTITNGIDLDGEGGLVWIKGRNGGSTAHCLVDTVRGANNVLLSYATDAQFSQASVNSFTNNGFTIPTSGLTNTSSVNYASWTFRKAEKFFDVVTYTGNGVSGRTVSHNLGSVPGAIFVKATSATSDWCCMVRASDTTYASFLSLNTTGAAGYTGVLGDPPTSTEFTTNSLGNSAGTYTPNVNGVTYVAYLFAHDAGGFGDDGEQNVISCGTFVTDGSGETAVTLNYEPQFVMIKRSSSTGNWYIFDIMRGMSVGSNSQHLFANTTGAEDAAGVVIKPTATGFSVNESVISTGTYIYIAIRRGPMRTPTAGTEVYNAIARTGTGAAATVTAGITPTDLVISKSTDNVRNVSWWDRLRGRGNQMYSNSTAAEIFRSTSLTGFDVQNGYTVGADGDNLVINASGSTYVNWTFRRAPGFFDVVCYTGTGSARTVAHNLGVAPELMIIKNRSQSDTWAVYAAPLGATKYLDLSTTNAEATSSSLWSDTSPTSSVFTVDVGFRVNRNTSSFVAYLFASLAGVSKVGTYTGNGSSVTVTTGFQPRFILVKRTDSTGNWIVGDSARGLVAGDDPFLELNTTDAEVTNEDWVDISATGFTVNETAANANVSTATYIYLAIA